MRNLITDVAGINVGNSKSEGLKSGATAILCDEPAISACHVMGGAPGTRDTDLLAPHNTVEKVDGIVLSGGSAFGLDACGGAQSFLRTQGRGFEVGGHRIPIVPGAILFDLVNGGDKNWGLHSPYRDLGYQAAEAAASDFAIGTEGAGTGAIVAGLKGGLGSASTHMKSGATIGALAAVNALGNPVMGDSGHFWAAPFEQDGEFGGRGLPSTLPARTSDIAIKFRDEPAAGRNTTIAVVATDASLTKAEAARLAMVTHDGFARALWPSHTPFDGDIVFALATGTHGRLNSMDEWIDLCALASATMARAIARGVHAASPAAGDPYPTWQQKFGQ